MYTIIMNQDKSLIASIKTTLYQREKLVDKIQFLLPQEYEPTHIQIKDCIILLKYIDQEGIPHAEKLVVDDELYKDKVRCVIDVDTNLTEFAGDIKCYLDFLKLNTDNGLYESVLSSGETIITIQPRDDYFAYVPNESLDVVNKAILSLEAKAKALESIAEEYNVSKADNIVKTVEDDNVLLQLASGNKPIGDKVVVGVDSEVGVPVVTLTESDENQNNSFEVVEF